MIKISDAAYDNAKRVFRKLGNPNPSYHDIERAVDRLLSEAAQHAGDPTSSLAFTLQQAFGKA